MAEARPGEGPYANPLPYDSPDLERSTLAGRIKVARSQVERYRQSGDAARLESWQANLDRLLDHYNAANDRAATAAMEPAPGEAHDAS